MMGSDVEIIQGDSMDVLVTLPARSVQLVMTSPPYWAQREYGIPSRIWDEQTPCDHEWGDLEKPASYQRGNKPGDLSTSSLTNPDRQDEIARSKQAGQFCVKCQAWNGTLGSEPAPGMYVRHLVQIFGLVWGVLRNDGVLVVNLGDSYSAASTHKGGNKQGQWDKSYGARVMRGNSDTISDDLPAKCLVGMPSRFMLAMIDAGWILRSEMTWIKRACLPDGATDRPTTSTEHLFMFTKRPHYFWDSEAVRRFNPNFQFGGARVFGAKTQEGTFRQDVGKVYHDDPTQSRNIRNGDFYFDSLDVLIKQERKWLAYLEAIRDEGGILLDENGDPLAIDVVPQALREAHYAAYPEKLVQPFLRAGTSEHGCCSECGAPYAREVKPTDRYQAVLDGQKGGEAYSSERRKESIILGSGLTKANKQASREMLTLGWRPTCSHDAPRVSCLVLDPFAGAGTTLLVAQMLGRRAVGIELSPSYCQIIRDRLQVGLPMDDVDEPKQLELFG
jgi:DNA modification methylase